MKSSSNKGKFIIIICIDIKLFWTWFMLILYRMLNKITGKNI